MASGPDQTRVEEEDREGWTGGGVATCRLCWDPESAPPDGILLSPCSCRGTCAVIHRGCLQRWLDTRPSAACDVCRAEWDAALLADAGVRLPPPEAALARRGEFFDERMWLQLAPAGRWQAAREPPAAWDHAAGAAGGGAGRRPRCRWWARGPFDARFWAGALHAGWRVAVALDGAAATLDLWRHRGVRPGGGAGRFWRRGPLALPCGTAEEVRASFDATTLWQVRLYAAAVALHPRGAAAEACGGMALGAIIGGTLSSAAFLPLVGLPRLAALAGGLRLAARASARLAAGLACRPAAHRRLACALAAAGQPLAWALGRLVALGRLAGARGRGRGGGRGGGPWPLRPPAQQQPQAPVRPVARQATGRERGPARGTAMPAY